MPYWIKLTVVNKSLTVAKFFSLQDNRSFDCPIISLVQNQIWWPKFWYCIHRYNDWGRVWITVWTHKMHPISCPDGRAMGCILWGLKRTLTALQCHIYVFRTDITYLTLPFSYSMPIESHVLFQPLQCYMQYCVMVDNAMVGLISM